MKVLIVDDSFYKIDILSKYINKHSPSSYIDTAESISNALQIINEKSLIYNLIIIDQYLPVRNGEDPIPDGGQKLLLEIYRTLKNKAPNYIIGFSQYDNKDVEFSKIWNVIKFSTDSIDWQLSLSEMLNHIKNNNFNKENEIIKPTIFVEGITDQFYLNQTIIQYFPNLIDKISVKTQKSAGSNWVANQLVAWSHSMFKDIDGNYIKSIGLFDNDDSGRKAKYDLDSKTFTENQRKTFKPLFLLPKYNPSILEFYKKGCKIDIDIESLFDNTLLTIADGFGYLENRNVIFVDKPNDWQQLEITAKDYLLGKGISEKNLVYLKKVKQFNKEDFLKIIKKENMIKNNLSNFKILVEDIIKELGVN